MKQMAFFFDQTRCTACYSCTVACKELHFPDSEPLNLRRIKIVEEGEFPNMYVAYLSASCYHCENPPCVLACSHDAITKREEDGIVVVDADKCVGNEECPTACRNACPMDAPQFGPEKNAKMAKCDFCLDRLEKDQGPVCVEFCPMLALDAGPLTELREKYGNGVVDDEVFKKAARFKPSVTFKPKPRKKPATP